jgi:putative aldouronate transport system permease protein
LTVEKKTKLLNKNIKSSTKRGKLKRFIPIYIMMLPGLVYLIINNYMPLPGLVIAFKQYNARKGIFRSDWIGFKNFEYLFKTSDAWIITRNTILYNIAFIIVNTVMAILVAVILSELNGKRKKVYQSIILLPNLISTVIIGYLVFSFFSVENGFVNNTILPLFGADPVDWYSKPKYWPFIIIFVSAWKSVGYNCIVYLATILGFDRAYYESAVVDGATRWKQFKYITLPLLKPTIIMLTLMAVGRIFYSDFGLFYQVPMNQGALYSTTNTIDTYVYRGLLQLGNISMSAAAGLYQSVIGFILVLGANLLVRKIDKDSALI